MGSAGLGDAVNYVTGNLNFEEQEAHPQILQDIPKALASGLSADLINMLIEQVETRRSFLDLLHDSISIQQRDVRVIEGDSEEKSVSDPDTVVISVVNAALPTTAPSKLSYSDRLNSMHKTELYHYLSIGITLIQN
ncbi:hypothetical protein DID80_02610 [Candidatus Marinamargulisbacteria bacterium SCGC AAA071-K20]|nr:hypothetical protein DID80_02610 [Candidatus Marinamargulisbacteria bacterium SCGC AAA071-K20]